jgi:hypothetical protein
VRDHLFSTSRIIGLLAIVGLVGCASPPSDEPRRVWVSVGGALESFEDDERHCVEEARGTLGAPMDEPLFAVCMFERGWRETHGEDPTLAAVSPVSAVRSKVNVRAHPSKSSEIRAGLPPGQRAQLLGQEGEWYHVRLHDGEEGYVSARWTQPLD